MLDPLDRPLLVAFLKREAQDFKPINNIMHTGESVDEWVRARLKKIESGFKRRKHLKTLVISIHSGSNMGSPMRSLDLQPLNGNWNDEGYLDGKTGYRNIGVNLCPCGRLNDWGNFFQQKMEAGKWTYTS